ncbi:MAG: GAF domain-containing protein [bacterium]|nr:GAF domain-containing protein [bacterium]
MHEDQGTRRYLSDELSEVFELGLDGRPSEALERLDRARASSAEPESLALRLIRARLLFEIGSPEARASALEVLQRLARENGDRRRRVQLALGRQAAREGRSTIAAEFLQRAISDVRDFGGHGEEHDRLLGREVARLRDGRGGATARDDLVALIDFGHRLAGASDPRELLSEVLREAVELAGARRGFVVLVRGEELECIATHAVACGEIERPEFKVSRTLIRDVSETRRTDLLQITELPADHPATESLGLLGIQSAVCVPIPEPGPEAGVIYLDDCGAKARLERGTLDLLELLAAQAAAALDNARAHEKKNRALERAEESLRRARLERRDGYDVIVGASDAMQEMYRRLDQLIPTGDPVLILGETGTGKELLARLVHERGPRADEELVTINCGGLAESLLESELFGHERGAFTGADRARPGLFELADGGTLFLDEVGEMSSRMQAALLRVLESGEVRRVGGRETSRVDVRVISATHRDLERDVKQGAFRRDLYYRLNVFSLNVPPLRRRPGDLRLLVEMLFPRLAAGRTVPRFTARALARLETYHWPGNVRELDNVLRRLLALGAERIDEADLPAEILRAWGDDESPPGSLREAEDRAIRHALETAGGNKVKAARILGIDRKTLYTKMKRRAEQAEP